MSEIPPELFTKNSFPIIKSGKFSGTITMRKKWAPPNRRSTYLSAKTSSLTNSVATNPSSKKRFQYQGLSPKVPPINKTYFRWPREFPQDYQRQIDHGSPPREFIFQQNYLKRARNRHTLFPKHPHPKPSQSQSIARKKKPELPKKRRPLPITGDNPLQRPFSSHENKFLHVQKT
jgi:hypothetical protein